MEEILVDENGYQQYLDEIEKLKKISLNNLTAGSEAYNDAIGDVLVLEIKYAEDDIEKVKIKLTGNYCPNTNLENKIQEITLNSPLGKAIYKKI